MTDLRDRMHDTVSHHHIDLDSLAARARSQGASLRRRRQAVAGSALAVVAIVATTGVAGAVLLADRPSEHQVMPPAATDSGPPPAPPAADTTPATGRTTVAALYAAVTDVVPGTATDFKGQGPSTQVADRYTYGVLAFSPADASGEGEIGINVQPASILDDADRGLTARQGFVCVDWMESCEVSTLPDGSLLRTYAMHTPAVGGGTGERLTAERLTGQLRVVASATNGFEGAGNHWDITRPEAVLSIDQLTTVVTQKWWGFELPAEFAGERDVPSYRELPSSIMAEPNSQD